MNIEKYVDNVTSQHRDKPKFISWLTSNIKLVDDAYLVSESIDSHFDLDKAIGKQLDFLGFIIGRERTLNYQPKNGYNPVLDDETYRLLLKAKVAINMWDGTIPHIYEIWDNIFEDLNLKIEDNQDMSFFAYIDGNLSKLRLALIQRGYIIPKPEGVRIYYVIGLTPNDLILTNKNYSFGVPYPICNRFNTAQVKGLMLKGDAEFSAKSYALNVKYPVCGRFKTAKRYGKKKTKQSTQFSQIPFNRN